MTASQIRAAAAVDPAPDAIKVECPWCYAQPGSTCHYRDGSPSSPCVQRVLAARLYALAAKGEREEAAAERVAAWEAEHGKLRPIRRGRR